MFFQDISYSSTVVLGQTFQSRQVQGNKGIAFPRNEKTVLSSVTSALAPRGVSDKAVIKTYASGVRGLDFCKESDEAIADSLRGSVKLVRSSLFVGEPAPTDTYIQRWPEALPSFDVGHLKRLQDFEKGRIEDSSRALTFAGDYIGGPFMEGAFTSGVEAAERLHSRFG